jgi:hypothetical protein
MIAGQKGRDFKVTLSSKVVFVLTVLTLFTPSFLSPRRSSAKTHTRQPYPLPRCENCENSNFSLPTRK